MIIALITLIILLSVCGFIIFKFNIYHIKLENKIDQNQIEIENLRQSFRNIMIDGSFLLNDGKIKKTIIEETKQKIFNGSNNIEEEVNF